VQVTGFVAGALLASRLRGRALKARLWALVVDPVALREQAAAEPGLLNTLYNGLGAHRAQLFAIGIAIWLWSRSRLGDHHLFALLTAALLAQAVHTEDLRSTIGLGVVLIGVCAAAGGPDWDVALVRALRRPIKWLAGISYGVYLVHQEIGYFVMVRVASFAPGPLVELAAFTGSAVALGWLLTKFVERPAYRALTANRRPAVVGLLLTAQSHLGSVGAVPFSRAPLWRPVSQPSTSAAAPLTSGDSSSTALSAQLR
jgi:peptidoglycan/LPS O-acetylase OafA/YrhL